MDKYVTVVSLLLAFPAWIVRADDSTGQFVVPKNVQSVIANRCIDCHGADTAEADTRLDNLAELDTAARLEL